MLDLSSYTEDRLREMNHAIVDELRRRTSRAIRGFRVGEEVRFMGRGRALTGRVTKINQKTVGVSASDGRRWRVSPMYLTKVDA